MSPEATERGREPVYLTPVRDLYGLDLAEGGRVEVRRHGVVLTAVIHVPADGGEPAEFDLRRWHYRQWATQIEDREYSEGLRGLIASHGLFEHPEWISSERPTDLDAEAMTVVDDLRATWRSRFGSLGKPPTVGAQLCSLCLAAEPPRGPLLVWSPSPVQVVCAHRDAAAQALLELAAQHAELVFELLDLLVVAQTPGPAGSATLRRFVLPSDWMRALLGHWLLGQSYVHSEHPWRARGATRHRRFSHRALRAEGHAELTAEERYSALAWGISADDLSLVPEEPESLAAPENSWWTETIGLPPAGVRVYPEGAPPRPAAAPGTTRLKSPTRLVAATPVRPLLVATPTASSAVRPPVKRAPVAKPKTKRILASVSVRAKSENLAETLSSLTAGLAALSQIMGGPKGGRR